MKLITSLSFNLAPYLNSLFLRYIIKGIINAGMCYE
jgi:hypothetical protein